MAFEHQLERGVLVERDDKAHRLERGQHRQTILERIDRPVAAFAEAPRRCIAVDADQERGAEASKNEVAQIVRSMPKVRSVQNELVVAPTSSLSARTNDTFITSKVKSRFVEAHDKFQINHVKVVTERGVVYLMGIVRRDEGNAAADIARTTSGVQRVVKVFEYIS